MTPIGLPAAWLAAGYAVPDVCVRHGEPAAFRLLIRPSTLRIANWPFCARCRLHRWAFMAAGLGVAFVPLVLGMGAAVIVSDPELADRLIAATAVSALFSLAIGGLIGLGGAPTRLARARFSEGWVYFREPHPAFAARIQAAADAARAQTTAQPAGGPDAQSPPPVSGTQH